MNQYIYGYIWENGYADPIYIYIKAKPCFKNLGLAPVWRCNVFAKQKFGCHLYMFVYIYIYTPKYPIFFSL